MVRWRASTSSPHCLARVATSRLLAIVGPSGSGKSSALRAGMLAALGRDVLPGSSTWRQVVMRPGRHPMREPPGPRSGGRTANSGTSSPT